MEKYSCAVWNHLHAFMTRSPLISGFQSSQLVSKPSAKRMQKFLKWPLLTKDSEEQAVMSVLSIVRTKAEPVSRSAEWLDWKIKSQGELSGQCNAKVITFTKCHLSFPINWPLLIFPCIFPSLQRDAKASPLPIQCLALLSPTHNTYIINLFEQWESSLSGKGTEIYVWSRAIIHMAPRPKKTRQGSILFSKKDDTWLDWTMTKIKGNFYVIFFWCLFWCVQLCTIWSAQIDKFLALNMHIYNYVSF